MYNPFLPFTQIVLTNLIVERKIFLVLQRFEWPMVEKCKGFLVTPYQKIEDAQHHASFLSEGEGKMLDLSVSVDTISTLLAKDSGYQFFLCQFKEENWKSRMTKFYKDKIEAYLRSKTTFTRNDAIDIKFFLEHGRVLAEISNGERNISIKAVDLIS